MAYLNQANISNDDYDLQDARIPETSGHGGKLLVVKSDGSGFEYSSGVPGPTTMKGTLGTGGTITSLPTASASNEGFTYKVITAGTYSGQPAKVGDMFSCYKPEGSSTYGWLYIPSGDEEDTDTWRNIQLEGTDILGSAITSGPLNIVAGNNVDISNNNGAVTFSATDSDHYPTTFNWTDGTTAGPTGVLSGNAGFADVSLEAIPSASASASGVVNTTTQTFAGAKTFNDTVGIGSHCQLVPTAEGIDITIS